MTDREGARDRSILNAKQRLYTAAKCSALESSGRACSVQARC